MPRLMKNHEGLELTFKMFLLLLFYFFDVSIARTNFWDICVIIIIIIIIGCQSLSLVIVFCNKNICSEVDLLLYRMIFMAIWMK